MEGKCLFCFMGVLLLPAALLTQDATCDNQPLNLHNPNASYTVNISDTDSVVLTCELYNAPAHCSKNLTYRWRQFVGNDRPIECNSKKPNCTGVNITGFHSKTDCNNHIQYFSLHLYGITDMRLNNAAYMCGVSYHEDDNPLHPLHSDWAPSISFLRLVGPPDDCATTTTTVTSLVTTTSIVPTTTTTTLLPTPIVTTITTTSVVPTTVCPAPTPTIPSADTGALNTTTATTTVLYIQGAAIAGFLVLSTLILLLPLLKIIYLLNKTRGEKYGTGGGTNIPNKIYSEQNL